MESNVCCTPLASWGLSRGEGASLAAVAVSGECLEQPVNSEADFHKVEAQLKAGQDVVFLVRPRGLGPNAGTIFMGGSLP